MVGLYGGYSPKIVQGPLNVLDQRLLHHPTTKSLQKCGGALHARSLFLQGLLLMAPRNRPARFVPWAKALERFDARVASLGTDPLALCLGFALSTPIVARLVVGVETPSQLNGIVDALKRAPCVAELSDLACDDPDLLEPRRWTA